MSLDTFQPIRNPAAPSLAAGFGHWRVAMKLADRASAENAALDSCRSLAAAATDCQIAVWFYNTCGSIAAAPGAIFGSGYGNPTHVAEGYALQSCRQAGGGDSCVVQKAVCTGL